MRTIRVNDTREGPGEMVWAFCLRNEHFQAVRVNATDTIRVYKPASHLLLFKIFQSLEQWRGRMNREGQMKAAWTLLQELEQRKQVRETARIVSVSLPAHLVKRLDNLEKARSRHVEKAVKLYLLLLERFLPNPPNE